jgi:integrase
MAFAKRVSLCWYCKTPRGWRYFPATFEQHHGSQQGRPGLVKDKGKLVEYPEGRFVLRSYSEGRKVYTALKDQHPLVVVASLRRAQRTAAADRHPTALLRKAAPAYVADCVKRRALEAAQSARVVLDEFLPLCKDVVYTRDVNREHIFTFHKVLRARGCSDRTVANKHDRLKSFLLFCNVDTSFLPKRPKYENKLPTIYGPTELKALVSAEDPYMRLVISMAGILGLREREMCFASWGDVDWERSVFRVRGKPKLGFTIKDSEQRDIPIPATLLADLAARLSQHEDTSLIVGTAGDKPNLHLLRSLKRLARRACLNCGECAGCHGNLKECHKWNLHKFRRTCLTALLRHGGYDLKTVQQFAGHSDLASTMRYLRPESSEAAQAKINQVDFGF